MLLFWGVCAKIKFLNFLFIISMNNINNKTIFQYFLLKECVLLIYKANGKNTTLNVESTDFLNIENTVILEI